MNPGTSGLMIDPVIVIMTDLLFLFSHSEERSDEESLSGMTLKDNLFYEGEKKCQKQKSIIRKTVTFPF